MGVGIKVKDGWKAIWTWLSHASTAITFIQIFGWWPWFLGTVGLAGGMIAGIAHDVPIAFIVLAAAMGFATLFTLALCWKYAREKHAERTTGPDDMWDHVDDFMVFQAACLWAGKEPKRPVPKGQAYAAFTLIKGALRAGLIQASNPNVEIDQFIRIPRSELRKLAEAKQMRPRFLFPEG